MIYALGQARPQLDSSVWIAPGCHVIGHVALGAGVSVWFGSTLRGDGELIDIEAGSNIQENAVLHTDIGYPLSVGRGCTIGHRVILHGCTIGRNSLIGMGAVILNGAVIGDNCLVGAGALVTEGKVIPAGSLVLGSPGRVARELSAQEITSISASATHYQQNAQKFAQELRAI